MLKKGFWPYCPSYFHISDSMIAKQVWSCIVSTCWQLVWGSNIATEIEQLLAYLFSPVSSLLYSLFFHPTLFIGLIVRSTSWSSSSSSSSSVSWPSSKLSASLTGEYGELNQTSFEDWAHVACQFFTREWVTRACVKWSRQLENLHFHVCSSYDAKMDLTLK